MPALTLQFTKSEVHSCKLIRINNQMLLEDGNRIIIPRGNFKIFNINTTIICCTCFVVDQDSLQDHLVPICEKKNDCSQSKIYIYSKGQVKHVTSFKYEWMWQKCSDAILTGPCPSSFLYNFSYRVGLVYLERLYNVHVLSVASYQNWGFDVAICSFSVVSVF